MIFFDEGRRREPNQANLENFRLQIIAPKRFKRSEETTKDKLKPAFRKLIVEATALAQIKIINEDLHQPNLLKNLGHFICKVVHGYR